MELTTPQLLKELDRLQESPYLEYLKFNKHKCLEELALSHSDIATRWLQGKVQMLDELMNDMKSAKPKLEKLYKPKIDMRQSF